MLGTTDSFTDVPELIAHLKGVIADGVSRDFAQSIKLYAAWGIWNARNANIFQGRAVSVKELLFHAFLQAEEGRSARSSSDHNTGIVNWSSHFCSLQKIKPIHFAWEFPQ